MEQNILVLDNGGSTIKAGFATNEDPTYIIPNTTARIKKSFHELIGCETETAVNDHSQLMYHRPIEKGYIVNWDYESKIWNQLLSEQYLNIQPKDYSLFMSQPLFNMDELMKGTLQVIFEHFHFNAFYSSPTPLWTLTKELSTLPDTDISKISTSGIIIDSGFSFTHIMPVVDGKVLLDGVRRVNVGGKLLTNLLKEDLSFRQVNVQDCTYLVNEIKEKYCFCSLNIRKDLDIFRLNPIRSRKLYVLPDYVMSSTGYELKPGQKVDPSQQVITLLNERFMVPEALFHPSDIGIRQSGIAECVEQILNSYPPGLRDLLVRNIVLTGEIAPIIEEGKEFRITQMTDPIVDTWRGGALIARQPEFVNKFVTRETYEEYGASRLLECAFRQS